MSTLMNLQPDLEPAQQTRIVGKADPFNHPRAPDFLRKCTSRSSVRLVRTYRCLLFVHISARLKKKCSSQILRCSENADSTTRSSSAHSHNEILQQTVTFLKSMALLHLGSSPYDGAFRVCRKKKTRVGESSNTDVAAFGY